MSFRIALSGLNAAQSDLDVTGNNIANSATTGFKQSRSEFADVYAVAFGGTGNAATGNGVKVANVAQQFTQGNIEFSNSPDPPSYRARTACRANRISQQQALRSRLPRRASCSQRHRS